MPHKSSALAAAAVLLLVTPTVVNGQSLRQRWGVAVSVAPRWRVPDYQKVFLDADSTDLNGTDLRVGLTKGRLFGGDVSVSFVRRTIADRPNALIKTDGTSVATRRDTLLGVAVQGFKPFVTIRQRAQIGASFGVGVGRYRGTVLQTRPGDAPEEVGAEALFSFANGPVQFMPLGNLELTGAAVIGTHVKVKIGGGVSFPGQQLVNVGLTYFF